MPSLIQPNVDNTGVVYQNKIATTIFREMDKILCLVKYVFLQNCACDVAQNIYK
jgi:hypothetical protein